MTATEPEKDSGQPMDTRTYIRLHDGMPDHPKIDGLSDKAFRLLVETWCWCSRHLTDGRVPAATWRKRGTPKVRKELIDAGLAEEIDGAVLMHDYLEHQRSAQEVEEIREAKRRGGAYGNHKRWHVDQGVVDPGCVFCCNERPNGDSSHNRSDEGSDMRSDLRSDDLSQNDRKTSPETTTETDIRTGPPSPPLEPDAETTADEDAASPGADAPGAELVLIRVEERKPKPKRTRRKKADRTIEDDLADGLTNGYWERYANTTAKSWIAVRQIVLTALKNGNERNDIAFALDLIGREGKPVTGNTLTFAITHIRAQRTQTAAPGTTVDRRQQATNDLFERAMQRAAAREEAS